MKYEQLGSSNLMVPEIGPGHLAILRWTRTIAARGRTGRKPDRHRRDVPHRGPAVGEAIGGIRDQVIVATKVLGSHLRYDEVLKAAEQRPAPAGRGPHRPVPNPLAQPSGADCRNHARHGPAWCPTAR